MIVEATVGGEHLKKELYPYEWDKILLDILLACNLSKIWTNCRADYIAEVIWPDRAGQVDCCNVLVRAAKGKDWVVASVLASANQEWVFYFLRDGNWARVSPPASVQVKQDGTIIAGEVEWPPFQTDWPNMIKVPGPYIAAGLLSLLVATNDENPLTILERSPQPFKGLAKQVMAAVVAATESLPRVPVASRRD